MSSKQNVEYFRAGTHVPFADEHSSGDDDEDISILHSALSSSYQIWLLCLSDPKLPFTLSGFLCSFTSWIPQVGFG